MKPARPRPHAKPVRFPTSAPYRGTSGHIERYYVAELDENHQVLRRLSPIFTSEIDGLNAWMRRKVRHARLVREAVFIMVQI